MFFSLFAVLLIRFGPVALTVCLFMFQFTAAAPVTLDPGAWFFGYALAGWTIVLATAAYGFHAALAGQPLFKDKLFQE